jgi:hypothetical protein
MPIESQLSELVDSPLERLDVEYKSWLDFKIPLNRANIARHVAALANYGGGYLVFGIEDNYKSSPQPNPTPFDHDDVSSIVKKYLEPGLQCDLYNVTASAGSKHEVIAVPPHGAVPICAKANGPESDGKIKGISAGAYYIRKVGPESAPILSASEWAPVIRRCALHERAAILSALGAVIEGASSVNSSANRLEGLSRWTEAALESYQNKIPANSISLSENNIRLSSNIDYQGAGSLEPLGFKRLLQEVNFEIERFVHT